MNNLSINNIKSVDKKSWLKNHCSLCNNKTVEFIGSGDNIRYKVCIKVGTPGHLTYKESIKKVNERRLELNLLRSVAS